MEKINKEIVLLLINGSHSAFSKIYVKCHRQFFLLALRYLKSKEMAEDAVQYSFMRLWETRTQIDVEQGVEPYLYGILKNHLLNAYKFHQLTLEKKEEIILGMPIWAGLPAAPVNTFIKKYGVADRINAVFTFSGGGDNDRCIVQLSKKLKNLKSEVALADRHSDKAKDNKEKLEQFVKDIK